MKKHVFYENLKLILTSLIIFYMIIIDFFFKFSFFENEFNIMIILINKFSKRAITTFEKNILEFIKEINALLLALID